MQHLWLSHLIAVSSMEIHQGMTTGIPRRTNQLAIPDSEESAPCDEGDPLLEQWRVEVQQAQWLVPSKQDQFFDLTVQRRWYMNM